MALPFICDHRSFPPPSRAWIMHQVWHDLLFAHWPVAATELCRLVPAALPLDLYDGQAWLGIVPFRMSGVRPRWLPGMPGLSAFPELNVRTYVVRDGMPGVYFFSLDATSRLAIRLARRCFHLPYRDAHITLAEPDGWIHYTSECRDAEARLQVDYRPTGDVYSSRPGTLEAWLTERYCMYPVDGAGRLYRGHVHHAPWPLQPAEACFAVNTMTRSLRLDLPPAEPLLHFSRRLDVVVWALERLC